MNDPRLQDESPDLNGPEAPNSPSVLLADEPTGNLDLHAAEEIMQLIISINALGTTVIMATHNQYLVDAYRQRVVDIRSGRVVRDEKLGRYNMDGEIHCGFTRVASIFS